MDSKSLLIFFYLALMKITNAQNGMYNILYKDRIFFNDDGQRYPIMAPFDKYDLTTRRGNSARLDFVQPTYMSDNDYHGKNLLAGDNVVGTNILAVTPRNDYVNSQGPQNNNFVNNQTPKNSNFVPTPFPQANNFFASPSDFANIYPPPVFGFPSPPINNFENHAFAQNNNIGNNPNSPNSNIGNNAFTQDSNPSRQNFENNAFLSNNNFGKKQVRTTQIPSINLEFYNQPSTERLDVGNNGAIGWVANATSQSVDAAALSVSNFGIQLMNILQGQRGNLVLSPFSIATLLALLQQGSLGSTQDQISRVLQLSPKQSADGFKSLLQNIQKSNSRNILNVANGVYIGESFNLNPSYKRTATNDFLSEVNTLMFSRPDSAVQTINKWISKKTNNRIENLLSSDSVNADTQLVLVNAVYFKGNWAVKFRAESTMQNNFFMGNGRTKTTWFMRMRRLLKTGTDREITSQIVILPFEGEKYSLVVILPSQMTTVAATLSSLTNEKLRSYQNFIATEVALELPKFTAKTDTNLFPLFQHMGIVDMFGPRSDLSGIGNSNNLPPRVSSALHSAMLSIDEQGGIAAGSTSFAAIALSNDEPTVSVTVNRPFLAVLWDNEISIPLFMAKIEDPVF